SFARPLHLYNDNGLVKALKDPAVNTTTYDLDSFNLYPVTVTNALKQATTYIYDYAAGEVSQKTDPNRFIFQYAYDGLGRLTTESQPDLSNPSQSLTKSAYTYVDDVN